jgi:hypothetical protein
MTKKLIQASRIEKIDRSIEDAVGRIMNGSPLPGDYGLVGDLSAERVEMSEPPAVGRLEELLGVELPRAGRARVYG